MQKQNGMNVAGACSNVNTGTGNRCKDIKHIKDIKGQTSVEFLVILTIAVLIITIIVIISQDQFTTVQNIKDQNDARNSLLDLSSAAKEVYAQGEGSKKQVFIQLPSSYDANYSYVSNRSIRIRAAGTDHVSTENFKVRGYLPSTPGGHWVWVVSEGNRVRIGNAMMELNKNWVYLIMHSNSTATTSFSVKNVWTADINVGTSTQWTAADVDMNGVPASFSLDVDETESIDLEFAADEDSEGTYFGQIELIATDAAGNTETVDVPVTVAVIPYGEPGSTVDTLGPIITSMYQDPTPATKYRALTIYVNATDSLTGNNTIMDCKLDVDSQNNWQVMTPVDGAYDEVTELTKYEYADGFSLGPHAMQAKCTDVLNNTGPTAYYFFNVTEADVLGPIVISMKHSAYPTTLSNITLGGIATDAYTGNNNVQNCTVKIDSSEWYPTIPDDGAWDSPTENFTYNAGPLPVGFHNVYYRCVDSLGNIGGMYNDSFGVVDVDLIIVLDRSGSMAWTVTNATDTSTVSAASTGWSWVKNLTVPQKNGDLANLTVELRASTSGCAAMYNVTIDGVEVASGNRTSTSYGNIVTTINVSSYEPPYVITLWLKRNASGCTAYDRTLALSQAPTKMNATQAAASSFLDIAGNGIQAGLVSYSTSATLNSQMNLMDSANQQTLKNAINALVPSGSTCIECGLETAANELTSVRARPEANKVIILLTDGMGNVGDSVDGAVYCRERNVTVFTIGFGSDVDDTELTNIALLTYGDYYFAPNAQTLTAIFQSIGKN